MRRVDASGRELVRYVEEHLSSDLTGMSILDLGCADGLLSFWAARRGAARVVGVERNHFNCDRAEFIRHTLKLENVSFRCGALERHCPEETFDVVFCFALIYHLVDPLGSLQALRSRCRGTLLLSSAVDLPDDDAPLSRPALSFPRRIPRHDRHRVDRASEPTGAGIDSKTVFPCRKPAFSCSMQENS